LNNNQLCIGNTQDPIGWNLDGALAEVIIYNAPLNAAQRIIVDNYLAAKYGRTLSSSDLFVQDLPANGDYDHDVAGIGRVSSSSQHTNSRGSGIVQISNPTGLGNDEFFIWGHDNGALGTFGVTDHPPTVQGRWQRVWRPSEVSSTGAAVDVGGINITFDLTGLGPVTAGHLRLLVDTDNDGFFIDETPIGGAAAVGGNQYRFSNVTAIANSLRFTLATTDEMMTPLPVELTSFTAVAKGDGEVQLDWSTASEHDNDRFDVERLSDGEKWLTVLTVDAIGNSATTTDYTALDTDVPSGVQYYRLRQTDLDGTSTSSNVVWVNVGRHSDADILVHPNPSDGAITVVLPSAPDSEVTFTLTDAIGRTVVLQQQKLGRGTYSVDPGPIAGGGYVLLVHVAGTAKVHAVRILR
jgi:hypothetical protein